MNIMKERLLQTTFLSARKGFKDLVRLCEQYTNLRRTKNASPMIQFLDEIIYMFFENDINQVSFKTIC